MAGGTNTSLILGGVGALSKAIPPEYQSTFATGAELAGISQKPATAAPSAPSPSSAPGPSPMPSGGFLDKLKGFATSKVGISLGVLVVAALGWKLYKGRR